MVLRLLSVAFRYSAGRDAYVLRGVGNRLGPVIRVKGPRDGRAREIVRAELIEQRQAAARARRREQRESRRRGQAVTGVDRQR